MNLLWLDMNSSYAHSSLALPALHAQMEGDEWKWHVVSGTLQTPYAHFIREAVRLQPDVVAATAWLFNHQRLLEVISRIKAIVPYTFIILGGPEFLGDNKSYLRTHPYVDAVFRGEGEEVFPLWLQLWNQPEKRNQLPGICKIDHQGIYQDFGTAKVVCFKTLHPPESSPFFPFDKPFVQIETSRGCFNDCYFCISGGDKPVRSISMEAIKERLQKLTAKGIREVRVLDRTFNAHPKRAAALLSLFCEFAGTLHFHVEIHPALLADPFLTMLQNVPEGLIHVEAGVQSLDDDVLVASGRTGSSSNAMQGLRLMSAIHRFAIHADLIAGLPNYTLARIKEDVRELISTGVEEVQLELLKLLPGTKMRNEATAMGIVYAPTPPYEVLATPTMNTEAISEAQQLSRLLDGWYNGNGEWRTPFAQLTLGESNFLDAFLHELMEKQLLEQPLSSERRGLLLYDFCHNHYPAYLSEISVAWMIAGYSLKKAPGQHAISCKNQDNNFPGVRFWRLPAPSGDYWFGFDRNRERRKPCIVLRHSPII